MVFFSLQLLVGVWNCPSPSGRTFFLKAANAFPTRSTEEKMGTFVSFLPQKKYGPFLYPQAALGFFFLRDRYGVVSRLVTELFF